jgi:hypothetical protein
MGFSEKSLSPEKSSTLSSSLFPHLVLENSGSVEEIHPGGSSFGEVLRNYRGIIHDLPHPSSDFIFEVDDYDDEIDHLSGNSLPGDWDPETDCLHPYVMLDDYNYRDVQVGDTVIFRPADPPDSSVPPESSDPPDSSDPSGPSNDPVDLLDLVPFPGPDQHWAPGQYQDSVILREGRPGSNTVYYL